PSFAAIEILPAEPPAASVEVAPSEFAPVGPRFVPGEAPEEIGWMPTGPTVAEYQPFPAISAVEAPALSAPPLRGASSQPGPREELPALTAAFRGLGLLFASGVSVGLAAWELRAGPKLARYVLGNDLPPRGRHFVLLDMFGTAAVLCLLALIYLVVRR